MKRRLVLCCLTVLATPTAALAATRVSSDSDCPSSDAISVRLLGLLAAGGPENASVRVHNDGRSMLIEVSAPGEANKQRTVPLTGDCDERAEMAAMIVASWLDAMPVGTIAAPGIPPRERREAARSNGASDASDDPDWVPTRTSGRTLVGAAVFGAADTLGGSGGLALSAAMPELIEDFGVVLEASLGWPRQLTVGEGTATYWRPTLALRASAETPGRHWIVRASIGPALGVMAVSGSGYQKNLTETSVMWGIDSGLAVIRRWRKHEAWGGLGVMAWPQGRHIRSKPDTPGAGVALPEWEARLAVGFSWGILQ
jgi:hypothetical protein